MPEDGLQWTPRSDLLTFEEIGRIVEVMATMGIRKIRITGGEPTVRSDVLSLVHTVASIDGISDIAMTTNGHTLEALAPRLAAAANPVRQARWQSRRCLPEAQRHPSRSVRGAWCYR